MIQEGLAADGVIYETQDEFVYVIKGEAEIGIEGQTRKLGPGDVLFVPANTTYDFKAKTAMEVVAVFSPPDE